MATQDDFHTKFEKYEEVDAWGAWGIPRPRHHIRPGSALEDHPNTPFGQKESRQPRNSPDTERLKIDNEGERPRKRQKDKERGRKMRTDTDRQTDGNTRRY